MAARAALWQAIDEHDDVVLEYVRNYVANARVLAEGLQALAAAAEERAEAGQHAHRLWPSIMGLVLDAAEANSELFMERTWGDYAEAALIPNPAAEWGYLTIELAGQPYRWRDPLTWAPQVDRWLGAITRSRMSIDHLVIAVRDLDVADQIEQGLRWIERIVAESGGNCASTFTLPEWLHERRADLVTEDQIARWQRVVDLLVVAGDSRVADLPTDSSPTTSQNARPTDPRWHHLRSAERRPSAAHPRRCYLPRERPIDGSGTRRRSRARTDRAHRTHDRP